MEVYNLYASTGERLDIIDHPAHDPDWWLARNTVGEQGLVPKNYIEVSKVFLHFDASSSLCLHAFSYFRFLLEIFKADTEYLCFASVYT